MKVLSTILIAVVSLHLQCGATCLAKWDVSPSTYATPTNADPLVTSSVALRQGTGNSPMNPKVVVVKDP